MEPNLVSLFQKRVAARDDAVAIGGAYFNEGREKSGMHAPLRWRQWAQRAERLAAGLIRLGSEGALRVGIHLPAGALWKTVELAVVMSKNICVPINPNLPPDRVRAIIDAVSPQIMVTRWPQRLAAAYNGGRESSACFDKIYYSSDGAAASRPPLADPLPSLWSNKLARLAVLEELGRTQLELDFDSVTTRSATITESDPFAVVFTAGTGGVPKGVFLDHGNMLAQCAGVQERLQMQAGQRQVLLVPPWCALGLAGAWTAIQSGVTTWFAPAVYTFGRSLREISPHLILGVPTHFEHLLEVAGGVESGRLDAVEPARRLWLWARAKVERSAGRRAKLWQRLPIEMAAGVLRRHLKRMWGDALLHLVCVGQALPGGLEKVYREAGFPLLHGYGMTETSGLTHLTPPAAPKAGTVGTPLSGIETRLSPEGEIHVRGRTVARGYFRRTTATTTSTDRETLPAPDSLEKSKSLADPEPLTDDEGWFATGDLGLCEEDCLTLVGPKQHVFRTQAGKPVAPSAIEAALTTLKPIRRAVVVGRKRPFVTALLDVRPEVVWTDCGHRGDPPAQWSVAADEDAVEDLRRMVAKVNRKLPVHERIQDFRVMENGLSEQNGEVGAVGQPLREVILQRYGHLVDEMYFPDNAAKRR